MGEPMTPAERAARKAKEIVDRIERSIMIPGFFTQVTHDAIAAALLEFVNEEVERRTVAHGTVELGCVYLETPLTPITTGQRVRVLREDNNGK